MEVAVATVWEHEESLYRGKKDCLADFSDEANTLSDEAESENTVPLAKRACSESPGNWAIPPGCAEPSAIADDDCVTDVSACRDVLERRRRSLA